MTSGPLRFAGYSTAESTQVQNAAVASVFESRRRALYPGGPLVTPIGFGSYRIGFNPQLGYPESANALRYAMQNGLNLVDTSTNYGDGQSELVIGRTLASVIKETARKREEFVIVSKVGYLQGENLTLARARELEGRPFLEVSKFSDEIWHCIHPDFIRDQVERSCARLGVDTIDVFLLHNPEYMLKKFEIDGMSASIARETFYQRIEKSFETLEELVANKKIKAYGVSSNTFGADESEDPTAVSVAHCLAAAEKITKRHHFKIVQMPMNWLEVAPAYLTLAAESDTAINYAAQHGLGVMLNRPLNAMNDGGLIRLSRPPVTRDQLKDMNPETAQGLKNWFALADDLEKLAKDKITTPGFDDAPLSQLVLSTLAWIDGVSAVLCGARRMTYIKDVEEALRRPKILRADKVLSQIFEGLEFHRVQDNVN